MKNNRNTVFVINKNKNVFFYLIFTPQTSCLWLMILIYKYIYIYNIKRKTAEKPAEKQFKQYTDTGTLILCLEWKGLQLSVAFISVRC